MNRCCKSVIWDHFQKITDKSAKCNYCSQIISVSSGSLGNLRRHLKTKHPFINIDSDRSEVVIQKEVNDSTENVRSCETLPVAQPSTASIASIIKPTSKPTLKDYMIRPISAQKVRTLDMQLIKMIVKEYHPISLVEDIEFKKFVNMLNPAYQIPTRKTVGNTLIPQVYNSQLEKIKIVLQNVEAACITTDSWTSINNESFVAITAHFFSEKFELCSILLECIKFEKRHTSDNISKFLIEKVEGLGLGNKIIACTTDNAANITAAVRSCQWRHLGCFAHSLNLIVQMGIKDISSTVTKVRSVIEFFKRSSQGLTKLQETQKQMNLPELKLKQDVLTRWNSTYEMLSGILQIKEAVISTLAVLENDLECLLTAYDWKIINHAIDVLKMFLDITSEISSEKNVSLSKVIPFVKIMKKKIHNHHLTKDETVPDEIIKMVATLKEQIDRRFANIEDNELINQSTILDPRFKKHGFINESKYKAAYDILKTKVSAIKVKSNEGKENITPQECQQSKKPKTDIWEEFDMEVKSLCASNNPLSAAIIELDKYVNEPLLLRTENALHWWKERSKIYPRLFEMKKLKLAQEIQEKAILAQTRLPFITYTGKLFYHIELLDIALVCDKLLDQVKVSSNLMVIGFDMEWPFNFTTGPEKTAVIQISPALHECYIFHVSNLKNLPKSLSEVLAHPNLRITGNNIKNDVRKLAKDFVGFDVEKIINNCVDLGVLANTLNINKQRWSLEKLVLEFLNLRIDKNKKVRNSQWHKIPLSRAQQKYAAIDAYASLLLYQILKKKEMAISQKEDDKNIVNI